MKIRPIEAELLQADGQTDIHDEAKSCFSQSWKRAKRDLKETEGVGAEWIGPTLRTGDSVRLLWTRQWIFWFHKRRGISWLWNLLTSQEELHGVYCMKTVNLWVHYIFFWGTVWWFQFFWDTLSCRTLYRYRRFGEAYFTCVRSSSWRVYLDYPEDGSSKFLRNVNTCILIYTASYPIPLLARKIYRTPQLGK